MERADQVFPERMIDADLAADRAVHLRQQRRRHVGQRDAAEISRRGKACRVAEDAAADGDDAGAPIGALLDEGIVDAGDGLQMLVSLAVGNEHDPASPSDCLTVLPCSCPPPGSIRRCDGAERRDVVEQPTDRGEMSWTDVDRIRTRPAY